ncbi:MAG: beta-glucanase [Bacteroidetes bacterium]|nr:MAG: beta-glucanase [Bacteroidota bacterium]
MRCILIFFICSLFSLNAQTVDDDFEGSGTITTWFGDDCGLNTNYDNPYQEGINTSNTVLEYADTGGQYANVRFDVGANFDLSINNSFSLKIYLPSSGLTGGQLNQISLKLQDGSISEPWITQSEIIKPLVLDQWQEVIFDFENDTYINLDENSLPPIERNDFNRVVIQVNGENNNDFVLAYIDDVLYFDSESNDPVYDNLVWADEFDGSGAVNSANWFHQTQLPAGGSWYNGEVQHYTHREDNSFVSGGFLSIVAKKETFNNQGYTKQYTSARLNSKFAFTYGKVEIRAQLPTGLGTWPAIWTLGQNITESGAYWETQGYGATSWPACGEIDIMEHWGNNQNYVQSAMHTPSSSGNTFNKGGQTVSTASTDFHVYTLEWSPKKMVFSVDGVKHYTYNPEIKDANTWPFDAPQYLLLNIAIEPSIDISFSQSSMVIDYVRVYQESVLSEEQFEENESISFYPNPVNDELHIKTNITNQDTVLQIIDVSGRVISQKKYHLNGKRIYHNTQSLNSGMYFATLKFANGSISSFKFIKG